MADRVLLGQGREAEVFLQGDGTVLKLLRDPSDEPRLRREVAALSTLRANGVAAPEVLDVVTVDGRPGLVIEHVPGSDLLTLLGRRPLTVFAAGRVMGEAHAAMHDCMAPTELPDLHDELRQRIQDAEALPDELRRPALDLLDRLPRGDRLCHGDFHVGNMLGSWAAPTVIDWGDAARGDPAADVARTVLLHRFGEPPPGSPRLLAVVATFGRGILMGRYLRSYRRLRPVDQDALDRWLIVRAAARMREPIVEEHPRLLSFLGCHMADGR